MDNIAFHYTHINNSYIYIYTNFASISPNSFTAKNVT